MNDADSQECDIKVGANILTEQKPNPTCDDEEHHAARVATQDNMKCQAIHRCDHKGEDKNRIRHGSCDSIFQW